jgi:hypothetical protein
VGYIGDCLNHKKEIKRGGELEKVAEPGSL